MPRIETLVQLPDGRIAGVDPRAMHTMPYTLLTNPPNNAVAIIANRSSGFQSLTISGDGPAEILTFAHEKTGACTVTLQMQDGQTQRSLMNRACHIDTIFGTGALPYRLPESLYVDELRSLVAQFTDLSGGANQVRIALGGKRHLSLQVDPDLELTRKRMDEKQYLSHPYWYTLDPKVTTVGAGATTRSTITVGQEKHFLWYDASVVATSMLFDVDLIDQARGESVIDRPNQSTGPVSANLILGNASYPFRLHYPRLFQIGQKIEVVLTDRSGAPNTIYLTLGGRAISNEMWRS